MLSIKQLNIYDINSFISLIIDSNISIKYRQNISLQFLLHVTKIYSSEYPESLQLSYIQYQNSQVIFSIFRDMLDIQYIELYDTDDIKQDKLQDLVYKNKNIILVNDIIDGKIDSSIIEDNAIDDNSIDDNSIDDNAIDNNIIDDNIIDSTDINEKYINDDSITNNESVPMTLLDILKDNNTISTCYNEDINLKDETTTTTTTDTDVSYIQSIYNRPSNKIIPIESNDPLLFFSTDNEYLLQSNRNKVSQLINISSFVGVFNDDDNDDDFISEEQNQKLPIDSITGTIQNSSSNNFDKKNLVSEGNSILNIDTTTGITTNNTVDIHNSTVNTNNNNNTVDTNDNNNAVDTNKNNQYYYKDIDKEDTNISTIWETYDSIATCTTRTTTEDKEQNSIINTPKKEIISRNTDIYKKNIVQKNTPLPPLVNTLYTKSLKKNYQRARKYAVHHKYILNKRDGTPGPLSVKQNQNNDTKLPYTSTIKSKKFYINVNPIKKQISSNFEKEDGFTANDIYSNLTEIDCSTDYDNSISEMNCKFGNDNKNIKTKDITIKTNRRRNRWYRKFVDKKSNRDTNRINRRYNKYKSNNVCKSIDTAAAAAASTANTTVTTTNNNNNKYQNFKRFKYLTYGNKIVNNPNVRTTNNINQNLQNIDTIVLNTIPTTIVINGTTNTNTDKNLQILNNKVQYDNKLDTTNIHKYKNTKIKKYASGIYRHQYRRRRRHHHHNRNTQYLQNVQDTTTVSDQKDVNIRNGSDINTTNNNNTLLSTQQYQQSIDDNIRQNTLNTISQYPTTRVNSTIYNTTYENNRQNISEIPILVQPPYTQYTWNPNTVYNFMYPYQQQSNPMFQQYLQYNQFTQCLQYTQPIQYNNLYHTQPISQDYNPYIYYIMQPVINSTESQPTMIRNINNTNAANETPSAPPTPPKTPNTSNTSKKNL